MLWASGGDGAKIYWLPHSRVNKLARGFNSKMNDNSFERRVLNMKRGFQRSQGNLRGWVRSTWMLHEISKSWFAIFPHENGLVSKHVRLSVWWECLVLLSVREMSDLRSELHWTAAGLIDKLCWFSSRSHLPRMKRFLSLDTATVFFFSLSLQ